MYVYKAKIINVVDGDTVDAIVDLGFHVNFEMRLRLADINTPELNSKILTERERAIRAKQFVIDFCAKSDNIVTINTIKDKQDKYGRYLAFIFNGIDYNNVNMMLVENGLAEHYV